LPERLERPFRPQPESGCFRLKPAAWVVQGVAHARESLAVDERPLYGSLMGGGSHER
jgi:hypothetical protein